MAAESHKNLIAILAQWFTPAELPLLQIEQLEGGLSGAKLWKVTTPQGSFCLRLEGRETETREGRLKNIHSFIAHTWRMGFRDIPLPKYTLLHATIVQKREGNWELTSWLKGIATRTPTMAQAKSASESLARFHMAGESYHQLHGCPPGLKHRLEILEDLHYGSLREMKLAVDRAPPSEIRNLGQRIISLITTVLPKAIDIVQRMRTKVTMQWCLIDPHIGNFLFTGNDVTGIVDFATAGMSSVAQDIARLVGSTVPHVKNPWRDCIEVYRQQRSLSADELRLIFAFHSSGTLGAAANWLRWRFVDDLPGADAAITHAKLVDLTVRLELLGEAETALSGDQGPIA